MSYYSSCSLIANNIEFDIDWPFEIIPGLLLRKPDPDELPLIQKLVAESCAGNIGWIAPYEVNWIPEGSAGDISYKAETIENQDLWKYWILQDDHGGNLVFDIDIVLKLLNPAIELGVRYIFIKKNGEKVPHGHSPIQHQTGKRHWEVGKFSYSKSRIGKAELTKLKILYQKLKEIEETFKFVRNALKTFNELFKVDTYSNLRVVGYFSVIEALITHSPRLNETLDSISHQIRGKMMLLNKRFDDPINFSLYFSELSEKKMWSKLYSFRSKIAHGEQVNFNGEMAALKNRETVFDCLEQVCKSLLMYAIKEPQLFEDLKEC